MPKHTKLLQHTIITIQLFKATLRLEKYDPYDHWKQAKHHSLQPVVQSLRFQVWSLRWALLNLLNGSSRSQMPHHIAVHVDKSSQWQVEAKTAAEVQRFIKSWCNHCLTYHHRMRAHCQIMAWHQLTSSSIMILTSIDRSLQQSISLPNSAVQLKLSSPPSLQPTADEAASPVMSICHSVSLCQQYSQLNLHTLQNCYRDCNTKTWNSKSWSLSGRPKP